MRVTDEDLELINALQIAPRAPWSVLGSVLRRNPSALAARWQRLKEAGVAWVIAYPKNVGGRGATALIALTSVPGRRQELLDWLLPLPLVASIEDSGGTHDLNLTVLTLDYTQLATEVLAPLRASQLIAHLNTSLVTAERATGGVWRLDALTSAQERELTRMIPAPSHRRKEDPAGLPALLEALGEDGRADVNHLAEVMGVHPSTAGRRLRQAVDEEAITFRCDMAQYDSGYPVMCQWFARVPPEDHDRVHAFLRRYRTLRLLLSVTGEANLVFTIWLRHPGEILQLELDLLAAVPTVRLLRTDSGLAMYKRMGRLLSPNSRAKFSYLGG
jgi:DNA-binding Lrp family transcriptional regulator